MQFNLKREKMTSITIVKKGSHNHQKLTDKKVGVGLLLWEVFTMNDKDVIIDRVELERIVRSYATHIRRWVLSLQSGAEATALDDGYMELLCQLGSYRTELQRHFLIHRTNAKDIAKYNQRIEHIAVTAEGAKKDIIGLKQELVEAQKVRDNKLDYDKIAPEILELRTREEYRGLIQDLENDIAMLKSEKNKKEVSLLARRRKFDVLVDAAKETQAFLETEREEDHKSRDALRKMDPNYAASDDEEEGMVRDDDAATNNT